MCAMTSDILKAVKYRCGRESNYLYCPPFSVSKFVFVWVPITSSFDCKISIDETVFVLFHSIQITFCGIMCFDADGIYIAPLRPRKVNMTRLVAVNFLKKHLALPGLTADTHISTFV